MQSITLEARARERRWRNLGFMGELGLRSDWEEFESVRNIGKRNRREEEETGWLLVGLGR
jgi:hypothetical protein